MSLIVLALVFLLAGFALGLIVGLAGSIKFRVDVVRKRDDDTGETDGGGPTGRKRLML